MARALRELPSTLDKLLLNATWCQPFWCATDANAFRLITHSGAKVDGIGCKAYLDTTGLGDKAEGYLPYRIREAMGACGVCLAESRDDAEIVVEAGLAAYGTDSYKQTFGITETDQLPELNVCVRDTQFGVCRLSLFAYERDSGSLVWSSGPKRADTHQRIREVLGVGPLYSGSIVHPANRIR
jgi:hypothetical protein